VPAQFSDLQRQDTAEAGRKAGLERVDIINEPVAAALCYVLSEGMWFAELAKDQTVMVFDLGGGTFDLSLVKYNQREVNVVASGGDLQLGGIDWNRRLEQFACDEFVRETPMDPRLDKESMQALANEVEQVKRSLSLRSKSPLTLQHAGRRKTFSIDQEHFELLSSDLVSRCEQITRQILTDNKLGWARVDAVLVTGGATRMPMIRKMLQRISGTTLNTTLSPDQSITHGAAYYAGMLLSGNKFAKTFLGKQATAKLSNFKQVSVNARALGILVRDMESGLRVPHYLLPANTPLPCAFRQTFGTVVPNQKRVHLHIVESGTNREQPFVKLGACVIEDLPANLPLESPIAVTIRYDEQARVHVEAKDVASGKEAKATIVREENMSYLPSDQARAADVSLAPAPTPASDSRLPPVVKPAAKPAPKPTAAAPPPKPPATPVGASTFRPAAPPAVAPTAKSPAARPVAAKAVKPKPARSVPALDQAERPVPLCNRCGEPLDAKGRCVSCGKVSAPAGKAAQRPKIKPPADADILSFDAHTAETEKMPVPQIKPRPLPAVKKPAKPGAGSKSDEIRAGEQEFWKIDE
jgi:molecular chaperone DnaK